MFEDEQWLPVNEEKLDHYLISTHGRVKRVGAIEARKQAVNDSGFPILILYAKDSKTRYLRQINRLVAEAFLEPPFYEDMKWVWHHDGNLLNCHVDNLRWDTRPRVMEWNEMHRTMKPKIATPRVKNNRTGEVYDSAFKAAIADGVLESDIVLKIERQARNMEDPEARYMYLFEGTSV